MIMKKVILLASIALGAIIFTSCEKNYTCVCTVNGAEVYREDLGKQSKSDAKAKCNASYSMPGVVAVCDLD